MSPRAGLDRPTIIAAAAAVADERGAQGVTLAVLAERLGVRPPSLYNHIAGLPDLRVQLSEYGLQQLRDDILRSLEKAGGSGSTALHAISEAYIGFARRHPGLYEYTLWAPAEDQPRHIQAGEEVLSLITEVLKPYGFGAEGEIHAVRGLRSLLHGFASLEQAGGFGLPVDTDDSLSWLLEAYIAGLHEMKE